MVHPQSLNSLITRLVIRYTTCETLKHQIVYVLTCVVGYLLRKGNLPPMTSVAQYQVAKVAGIAEEYLFVGGAGAGVLALLDW